MQISEFQLWIHEFILLIMSKDKSFIDNEVSDYTHEMRALSKIIGEIQLISFNLFLEGKFIHVRQPFMIF